MTNSEEMIEIDGCRVRVSIRGSGPPLLMFNGLGAHVEILDRLRDALPGHRTIAFDAVGVGRSDPVRGIMRMRHHAAFAAKILDRLQIARADIFGVSWGGALAQEFTFRHPERVGRVVLAATTMGPGLLMSPDVYLAFMDPRKRTSEKYVAHTAPKLFGGKVRSEARALLDSGIFSFLTDKRSRSYYVQMAAAAGWSSIPYLWRINKPVLILAGKDDPLIRPYNARLIHALLRGSELRFLDGEGHLFVVTSATETASYVQNFLACGEKMTSADLPSRVVPA